MKGFLRGMAANFGSFGEVFAFMWKQKLWWLMPMVALMLVFGLLLVFANASGLGAFIYAVF